MIQAKAWGTTSDIWAGNNAEIHRIDVVKGGYCSKHKHDYKYNKFYVESGLLQVSIWDEGVLISSIIGEGESTSVEPKMYHKFIALEKTVAYEIYWVELFKDDIQRESFGGVDVKNN